MHNQTRLFAFILFLNNHYITPMLLHGSLKNGVARVARLYALRKASLGAHTIKRTPLITQQKTHPLLLSPRVMPARRMSAPVHVKAISAKRIATRETEAGLPLPNYQPKKKNLLSLGSSLIHEKPVKYTIDESLFLHLCVQASKAQHLDQKPLHQLIKKITGLKKATFNNVKYNHNLTRTYTKHNYGPIELTKAELVKGLLQYIPFKLAVDQTAIHTSRGYLVSKNTALLNEKEVILNEDAITAPIEEVRNDAIVVSYLPVEGEKRIEGEIIRQDGWKQMLCIDSLLVSDFNTLLKQIENPVKKPALPVQ